MNTFAVRRLDDNRWEIVGPDGDPCRPSWRRYAVIDARTRPRKPGSGRPMPTAWERCGSSPRRRPRARGGGIGSCQLATFSPQASRSRRRRYQEAQQKAMTDKMQKVRKLIFALYNFSGYADRSYKLKSGMGLPTGCRKL
jgi:hypothetical protein